MQSQKRNCVQISVKAELQALYDTGKYAKLIIVTWLYKAGYKKKHKI